MDKTRLYSLISLIIIIPAGLFTKFYNGPYMEIINNSVGGVFYEIFWCLLIFFLFQNIKAWKIASLVFIITVILEFLQLWHPRFLEILRNNFVGRTILGSSFTWKDFPYYIIGSLFGFFWLKKLQNTK